MEILLVLLLAITACAKVMLQSGGARAQGSTDPTRFNLAMFATIGIFFLPHLLTHPLSRETLLYGVAAGLSGTFFQTFYMKSFSLGKVSLTVLLSNCFMPISVAYSVLTFHEGFSLWNGLGLALVILSLWLNSGSKGEKKAGKTNWGKWLICVTLAGVSVNLSSIIQITYGRLAPQRDIFSYVGIVYLTGTLAAALLLLAKRQPVKTFLPRRRSLLMALGAGVMLGLHQCLNTYASSVIAGKLFFPTVNCAINITVTLAGVVLLGETFTRRQKWGIPISIVAIFLLSV